MTWPIVIALSVGIGILVLMYRIALAAIDKHAMDKEDQ